jgi:hypothetical protein
VRNRKISMCKTNEGRCGERNGENRGGGNGAAKCRTVDLRANIDSRHQTNSKQRCASPHHHQTNRKQRRASLHHHQTNVVLRKLKGEFAHLPHLPQTNQRGETLGRACFVLRATTPISSEEAVSLSRAGVLHPRMAGKTRTAVGQQIRANVLLCSHMLRSVQQMLLEEIRKKKSSVRGLSLSSKEERFHDPVLKMLFSCITIVSPELLWTKGLRAAVYVVLCPLFHSFILEWFKH